MLEQEEVISVYSDEDAVEDGTLHVFHYSGRNGVVDRVTNNVYFYFTRQNKNHDVEDDGELQLLAELVVSNEWPDNEHIVVPAKMLTYPGDVWAVKNERGNYTLMLPQEY